MNAICSDHIDGVVIGMIVGFDGDKPIVVFPGNRSDFAIPARSLVPIQKDAIGRSFALLFEGGDPCHPIVVGRLISREDRVGDPVVTDDEGATKIEASRTIEIRCGKASIVLHSDGRINLRGSDVNSRASGSNRIQGGSVNLN